MGAISKPETLILSPHHDDAVLSCWGQIDGQETRVITVFAGLPKDRSMQGHWDRLTTGNNGVASVVTRSGESLDALAHAEQPVRHSGFPYIDRQYAGRSKRDIDAIADKIENNMHDGEFHTYRTIASLGGGNYLRRHPDHATVRDVGLELSNRGKRVQFYADIPYWLPIHNFDNWPERLNEERIKRMLDRDVEIEVVELTEEQQQRKHKAVETYETQYDMVNLLALGALKRQGAYRWEALVHLK